MLITLLNQIVPIYYTDRINTFPFNDLSDEIWEQIFYYVSKSDLKAISLLSKRLNKIITSMLWRNIHIVLLPERYAKYDFYSFNIIRSYSKYSFLDAPDTLYPHSSSYAYSKNIHVLHKSVFITKLIHQIMMKPHLAQQIKSFSVEFMRCEDYCSGFILQYYVYGIQNQCDPDIISLLANPLVLTRLTRCNHFSLPLFLIPSDQDGGSFLKESPFITGITLNTTPISYFDGRFSDPHFGLIPYSILPSHDNWFFAWLPPVYSDFGTAEDLFSEFLLIHEENLQSKITKCPTLKYNKKNKAWLIATGARKLMQFLDICSTNENIDSITFNGFESFQFYCDLLSVLKEEVHGNLSGVPKLSIRRDLYGQFPVDDLGDVIAIISGFCSRLYEEPKSGSGKGFMCVSAINAELKYVNEKNYSFIDLINFLEKFNDGGCKKNSIMMKVQRLHVHQISEDLHFDGEDCRIKNDNYSRFMKEMSEIKKKVSLAKGYGYLEIVHSWRDVTKIMKQECEKTFTSDNFGDTDEHLREWNMVKCNSFDVAPLNKFHMMKGRTESQQMGSMKNMLWMFDTQSLSLIFWQHGVTASNPVYQVEERKRMYEY